MDGGCLQTQPKDLLGTVDGEKIEQDFYSVKRASICHNFSKLLAGLGGGSKAVGEVKHD